MTLGDRMKTQYEDRYRVALPRRTYTIVRVDGKAWHSFTRSLAKPFDSELHRALELTMLALMQEMQGARLAYQQSDEISVLLTDFESVSTEAWFDGNLQKVASVSSSLATAYFAQHYEERIRIEGEKERIALFDARAFVIPDREEVGNYFVWRQRDCVRNSISGVGQSYFSHNQLEGKNCDEIQEMLFSEHGVNWAKDTDPAFRNGTIAYRSPIAGEWDCVPAPTFTQDRAALMFHVPVHGYGVCE